MLTLAGHGALVVERDDLVISPETSATTVKEKLKDLLQSYRNRRLCRLSHTGYYRVGGTGRNLYIGLGGRLCLNLIPAISSDRTFHRKAQYTADFLPTKIHTARR